MHRVPTFSRTPLRQRLLRTATVVVLSAASAAHGLSITGPATQYVRAIAGRPYTFTPKVVNPSGRALTFKILNKPAWAALNASTGQLSGTPPQYPQKLLQHLDLGDRRGDHQQDTLFHHPRVTA